MDLYLWNTGFLRDTIETLNAQWASLWAASDGKTDPWLDTGLWETKAMPFLPHHAITKMSKQEGTSLGAFILFFQLIFVG